MPSGHSASAVAFAVAVGLVKPSLGFALAPAALGVAYSRVHTGAHWPSDVLFGSAIGAGAALVTRRWWPVRPPIPPTTRTWTSAPELPEGDGLSIVVNTLGGSFKQETADALLQVFPKAYIRTVEPAEDLARSGSGDSGPAGDPCPWGVGRRWNRGSSSCCRRRAFSLCWCCPAELSTTSPGMPEPAASVEALAAASNAAKLPLPTSALSPWSAAWRTSRKRRKWPCSTLPASGSIPTWCGAANTCSLRWASRSRASCPCSARSPAGTPSTLTVDGRRHKLWIAYVGRGRYYPRDHAPLFRPVLDDGVLDVRMITADESFARLRLLWSVLTGTVATSRITHLTEATHVRIEAGGSPMALAVDGEAVAGVRVWSTACGRGHWRTILRAPDLGRCTW
jgi:hypothetical protein